MRNITVDKQELLTKLRENQTKHRQTFDQAKTGYSNQLLAMMDELRDKIRDGGSVTQDDLYGLYALSRPEDHSNEYETVIQMLDMTTQDEIELSQAEFNNYVRDQWQWSGEFAATTASYAR